MVGWSDGPGDVALIYLPLTGYTVTVGLLMQYSAMFMASLPPEGDDASLGENRNARDGNAVAFGEALLHGEVSADGPPCLYDLLLGHFGRENPAVGVGLYIDQLTSSLIRQGIPYGESVNEPDTANECEA